MRLISNLIALNDPVKDDPYKTQNMREAIRTTAGYKWSSLLDLKEAFYYIETEEKDKEKTVFEFNGNIYE